MQAFLLIENNELAVLVGLLQDVFALLDVAVVVFQAKEGGHQGHVGLNEVRIIGDYKTWTLHISFNSSFTRLKTTWQLISLISSSSLLHSVYHLNNLVQMFGPPRLSLECNLGLP